MEPVRSPRNRRVVEAVRLHRTRRRAEQGLTLLEGPNLLGEALRAGIAVRRVFVVERDAKSRRLLAGRPIETVLITQTVMDRLAPTQHPRGPVAVIETPASAQVEGRSVLVAWGVGDPGNLGTLIRSAAAFGIGFISGPNSADPWAPKVLRSGAGAHFRTVVEIAPQLSIRSLRARGFVVVASTVAGGQPPEVLRRDGPWAVLIGDEAGGLPAELVSEAGLQVTIPMPGGTESLNAATAGSLLAYEIAAGRPARAGD